MQEIHLPGTASKASKLSSKVRLTDASITGYTTSPPLFLPMIFLRFALHVCIMCSWWPFVTSKKQYFKSRLFKARKKNNDCCFRGRSLRMEGRQEESQRERERERASHSLSQSVACSRQSVSLSRWRICHSAEERKISLFIKWQAERRERERDVADWLAEL